MGLSRFELLTPRLSSVCSNQLSYRPFVKPCLHCNLSKNRSSSPVPSKLDSARTQTVLCQIDLEIRLRRPPWHLAIPGLRRRDDSRKEVIQPQVLLQLPCYDFTPITNHTLGTFLPCGLEQLLLVQPAFVM